MTLEALIPFISFLAGFFTNTILRQMVIRRKKKHDTTK